MPLDASIAEECVRQGVYFAVEPHYLMAVAQLRSAMPSDPARQGPYRLTQAEWDANSNDDDFDVHFTPAEISSPLRQCAVFALMAKVSGSPSASDPVRVTLTAVFLVVATDATLATGQALLQVTTTDTAPVELHVPSFTLKVKVSAPQ